MGDVELYASTFCPLVGPSAKALHVVERRLYASTVRSPVGKKPQHGRHLPCRWPLQLFLSIFACVGGVAFCAWGVSPEINGMLHLTPFPDDQFRCAHMIYRMVGIICRDGWLD